MDTPRRRLKKATKATRKKVVRKKATRKKAARRKPKNPKVHDVEHVDEIDSLTTLENRVGAIFDKAINVGGDIVSEIETQASKLREKLESDVNDLLDGIETALDDLRQDIEARRENAEAKADQEEWEREEAALKDDEDL